MHLCNLLGFFPLSIQLTRYHFAISHGLCCNCNSCISCLIFTLVCILYSLGFFLCLAHSFSVLTTEFSLRVGFGLKWLEMHLWLVPLSPSDLRIIDLTPVWPSMNVSFIWGSRKVPPLLWSGESRLACLLLQFCSWQLGVTCRVRILLWS